jgi:nucleotide-binding universal stress UspA family protein
VTPPVVVGYDGSPPSEAALERALEEANASGGQLVVIAVTEMPLLTDGGTALGPLGEAPLTVMPGTDPPDVERLLSVARERVEGRGVEADYVWGAGPPAAAILREAQERGAGTVVVGRGHHSRLGRWLGNDTAAEIERSAECSVIVVDEPLDEGET